MSFRLSIDKRVAEVVMDFPPVKSLKSMRWPAPPKRNSIP